MGFSAAISDICRNNDNCFFVIFLMLLDIVHFRNPLANHMEKLTFERQLLNSFVTGFLRF